MTGQTDKFNLISLISQVTTKCKLNGQEQFNIKLLIVLKQLK